MEIQADTRVFVRVMQMELAGFPLSIKTSEVVDIEICLEELSTMKPAKLFPYLHTLTIVNTQITKIEGLHSLKVLKELHLSENLISTIEGLEGLESLKKLNLSNNKIKQLENLESLTSLEWLWVNENCLTAIEGLSQLCNLTELSLAKNFIQCISNSLPHLSTVSTLNLSGNPICSFSEIYSLSRLPRLRNLSLNDPNYGESSICGLSNYSIFVINYLRQITVLDFNQILPESRTSAESTFLKKKMFYSMKARVLKRSLASLIKSMSTVAFKKQKPSWDYILALLKQAKRLEHEIDQSVYQSPDNFIEKAPNSSKPNSNIDTLHSDLILKIKEQYQRICGFNRILKCIIHKIKLWGYSITKEIELEFSAGGNLKFEEGSPNDSWYKSCCELILSRQGQGMVPTVTRVVKIHNRLLKSRFDERLESLVDISENYYKRNIDYLFYSNDDIPQIISDGFKSPAEYLKLSQPGCIPLAYSLETAEIQRVRQMDQEFDDVHEAYWPKGRVLLCKVYFGKGKGDLRVPYYQENMTPREVWELYPFNPPNVCWAVYRTFEFDIKQRVWFIFDNTLVLPEYLVELEYSCEEARDTGFQVEAGFEAFSKPISLFFSDDSLLEKLPVIVNAGVQEKAGKIENIEKLCRGSNLEYLSLLECQVSNIDFQLLNLEILILSSNSLESVNNLSVLRNLIKLDLSFNLIERLNGLSFLNRLNELDLHDNKINSLGEITKLPNVITKITCFNNEIYSDPEYDEVILCFLPNLQVLDWRNISKNPRRTTLDEIDLEKYLANQPEWISLGTLEILELENACLLSMKSIENCVNLKRLSLSSNIITKISNLEGCVLLEDLDLSNNYIENIENLSRNTEIKYLDLSFNKLSKISNISHLLQLTRLCLDGNSISLLSEAKELYSVCELYISNNLISDIKEIVALKSLNLMVLDAHNNPCFESPRSKMQVLFNLSSLKVLNGSNIEASDINLAKQELSGALSEELLMKKCTGLKPTELRQLDLSYSKLRSIEGMFTAEQFPKLLELNLSNNSFISFSMFNFLPMLAKLDLSNNKIDSFQYNNKGFSSCPNIEILHLAYNSFSNLVSIQSAQLRNLRILNLSHNLITRIDCIEHLTNLRELDISFNKIRNIDRRLELPHIRSVNFDCNGLKNLHFLENLAWIQAVKAAGNRISELNDVEKIQNLPSLLELMLNGNPIERKAGYRNGIIRRMPNLLFLDGKAVTEEEKVEELEMRKLIPNSGVNKLATKIASITLDAYFLKVHPRTAGHSRKN